MVTSVDAASTQGEEDSLPRRKEAATESGGLPQRLPADLVRELWDKAKAITTGLSLSEFAEALLTTGRKVNFGQAADQRPSAGQQAAFLRGLHVSELALAHACGLGHDAAWQRLLSEFKAPLTRAAVSITGTATLGHELADSLYAELYGLTVVAGERRSPLFSYTGRGSLMGWLRATLAQRHVDHHRRTFREVALDERNEGIAAPPMDMPTGDTLRLQSALAAALTEQPAEDRFLLCCHFLDRLTLLQISRMLHVHEATVSRRIHRVTAGLRKQLLLHLQSGGLSRRAAEEALGADPRDVEITCVRCCKVPFHPRSFKSGTNDRVWGPHED